MIKVLLAHLDDYQNAVLKKGGTKEVNVFSAIIPDTVMMQNLLVGTSERDAHNVVIVKMPIMDDVRVKTEILLNGSAFNAAGAPDVPMSLNGTAFTTMPMSNTYVAVGYKGPNALDDLYCQMLATTSLTQDQEKRLGKKLKDNKLTL